MPAYRLPEGVNLPERFLEDVLSIQESAAADAIKTSSLRAESWTLIAKPWLPTWLCSCYEPDAS